MAAPPLKFKNPIQDAISRIRFAPKSDNLLISSWDCSLRLYDVGSSQLRLKAPSKAALLDFCFQDEFVAFTAGFDGFIRRYDFHSGIYDSIGNHDDIPTCVGYSGETKIAALSSSFRIQRLRRVPFSVAIARRRSQQRDQRHATHFTPRSSSVDHLACPTYN